MEHGQSVNVDVDASSTQTTPPQHAFNVTWRSLLTYVTVIPRLPNETQLLVASDSGEVQVWNCHLPGNTAEYQCSLGSHDDMVLTLTRTADHERVISGGADSK